MYKAQKVALYWLLGLIYSAFIGLQLGRVQAIADFNYSLHEIMYLPFNLAVFIVPVIFLIYLYFLIKYFRKRGSVKVKENLKASIKAAVIIISVITILSIINHQFHEVSTGGVFKLEEKLQEKGKYYLIFDDKKIKVSMNEYKLVKVNEKYIVNFIWNLKTPNEGKLTTIEPMKEKE